MTPPANGHFKAATNEGAFNDALWCQDWTALADNQHLAFSSKVIVWDPATPPPTTITVTAMRDGANVILTWTGSSGSYTVHKKTDLVPGTWTTDTSTSTATYTVPIKAGAAFCQVTAL